MSGTELVVGAAVTVVLAVFLIALRVVSRRSGAAGVPDATVVDGGSRWLEGQGRARFIRRAEAFHRVAVAAAVTGIAIMVVCVLGITVLGIAHALT
jgi:hypothetical protein